jgi:hypothetical protein
MDDLIAAFINTAYTEEMQREIYSMFQISESFDMKDPYSAFLDIVTDTGSTNQEILADQFISVVHDRLDFLLHEHTIRVIDGCTIAHKNQILNGLYRLMALEDYTGVIAALESFEDQYATLALILSEVCMMDSTEIMLTIDHISDTLLIRLKQYVYAQERPESVPPDASNIIMRLKVFTEMFEGHGVGIDLVTAGFMVGESFSTYYGYVSKDIIGESDDATALNILSIIYMTPEGVTNPIGVYRDHSAEIFSDLQTISKMEVAVIRHIGHMQEHLAQMEVRDDQV